jgi:hypothetical protein
VEDGEKIASYDAHPKRGPMYRSRSLRCAEVRAGPPLPTSAHDGPLTINSFLFGA